MIFANGEIYKGTRVDRSNLSWYFMATWLQMYSWAHEYEREHVHEHEVKYIYIWKLKDNTIKQDNDLMCEYLGDFELENSVYRGIDCPIYEMSKKAKAR